MKIKNNFKKLTSAILVTAMLICSLFTMSIGAYSAENDDIYSIKDKELQFVNNLDYTGLTDNEKLIYDFYDSINIGDWDKWSSYYVSVAQQNYKDFVNNSYSIMNNVGILTVESTNVIEIEKVDNSYAPYYQELSNFYEADDTYECYLATIKMTVKEETDYFFNGINYKLVIIVKDGDEWKIGSTCACPYELLITKENTSYVSEAINRYETRLFGQSLQNDLSGYGKSTEQVSSPDGVGYGLLPAGSVPSQIRIYYSGQVWTDSMNGFIQRTISNEVPYTYNQQAINANCMAIKMCGWWAYAGQYRDAYGADIMYGDVAYNPYTDCTQIDSKYLIGNGAVSSYRAVSDSSSGNKLFYMPYFAGTSDNSGAGSGRMRQNGSNYLAGLGYSWQQIIHYYYDNSSYNNPNVGIVSIY